MTSIDNIEIFPILSLLIFVIFFAAVLFYVFTMKKPQIKELSATPFEAGELDETDIN